MSSAKAYLGDGVYVGDCPEYFEWLIDDEVEHQVEAAREDLIFGEER